MFYSDPSTAATRLAERAMCKIRLHGTMQVRQWRGRIHINPPCNGLAGRIVGIYDRTADAERIAADILFVLEAV